MIEICKLTQRQIDPSSKKLPKEFEHVKVFSMSVGHGIGTVDFVECVGKIEEDDYYKMIESSGQYAKFKLGNLSKYFEVEVFPEHAIKLLYQIPDGFLKDQFRSLTEGYIVIRKLI